MSKQKVTVLQNVQPYGEAAVDIVISEDQIIELAAAGSAVGDLVIDATGLIALPGLVDLHTHLREPGREDAETVLTASKAAALGGYTSIFAMPNTSPVADNAGVVEQVMRLGQEIGLVDVHPIGAITINQAGSELAELGAMADSAAKVRIFSDDGHCLADAQLMRRALEYVKSFDGIIAQHAQDPSLTKDAQMNEGAVSAMLGLRGWPAVAEESIIARDCLLAEHVDSRYHVLHLTTAKSVDIVKDAKARGVKVTAEVTPHHLLLTDESVKTYNPVYKVNPPLRTEQDVMALRVGLAAGIIDSVGTDHAPHSIEHKDCEWDQAAFGMLGLQTSLSVLIKTMIETKLISWRQLADRMSTTPAHIAGLSDQGQPIEVGAKANLVLLDPSKQWTVTKESIASKSLNTPFENMVLPGVVVHTLFKGKFTVRDTKVAL
jgi:dihydroorotase